jgi:hypothetical protein
MQSVPLASLSEKLGSPSEDTGWEEFLPESEVEGTEYAAVAGQYYQSDDNLGPAWGYAVHRKVCWETLCVRLGGESQETAQLRGWEWNTEDYLPPTATVSNAELAGTGIQLGSTWEELQAAYPGVVAGRAEGGALAVDNRPWDGFFDGVSEWRLSGHFGPGATQLRTARCSGGALVGRGGPATGVLLTGPAECLSAEGFRSWCYTSCEIELIAV